MARTSPVSGPTSISQLSRKLTIALVSGGGGRTRLARPSRTQGNRMQSGANFEGKGVLPGRQERTIRQFLKYCPGAGRTKPRRTLYQDQPSRRSEDADGAAAEREGCRKAGEGQVNSGGAAREELGTPGDPWRVLLSDEGRPVRGEPTLEQGLEEPQGRLPGPARRQGGQKEANPVWATVHASPARCVWRRRQST